MKRRRARPGADEARAAELPIAVAKDPAPEHPPVGRDMPNAVPPVYTCGYSDPLEDVDDDGCFPVPDGPGLGVSYDWGLIEKNRTAHHVFG